MASSRNDEGQLLLLAGVLIVISYVLFSSQASLVATLGQQSGREASNPVINDYVSLRETLVVTLVREHTDYQGIVQCPAADEEEYRARAEAILANLAALESRRGVLFLGEVVDVTADDPGETFYDYELDLFLTNGETTVTETASFLVEC